MEMATVTLNNGVVMPRLGIGVWRVPEDAAEQTVAVALDAGYRSVDTAKLYRNEAGVGRAVRRSGVPRADLFVTTKLWNDDHGYDAARRAFDASLDRLGMDYVDLYLIHWPAPGQDRYREAWRALERIHADGHARAVGVSNFAVEHLRRLLEHSSVVPAVNQVELHPYLPQPRLRAFGAEHGIVTEAWSPLGQGRGLLDEPVLAKVAARHGRTPAQVALRWQLQLGNVTIPRSVTPARIRENLDVFGFELDGADLAAIATLDRGTRLGPDPARFWAD